MRIIILSIFFINMLYGMDLDGMEVGTEKLTAKEKLKRSIEQAIERGHDVNMPLPEENRVSLHQAHQYEQEELHCMSDPLLHQVCFDDFFVDTVKLLLEAGADVWKESGGDVRESVFCKAAGCNAIQNLKILIDHVKKHSPQLLPQIHRVITETSPLHATIPWNGEALLLLLQAGANPNECDKHHARHGLSPLCRLIETSTLYPIKLKSIKALILYGAHLNEEMYYGSRPLSLVNYVRVNLRLPPPRQNPLINLLETMPVTLKKIEQWSKIRKDNQNFISMLTKELFEQEIYFILEDKIPLPDTML